MYNGVQLHSSYETRVAIDLDANNIRWTRPAPIIWRDTNGENHRYYPDFYLPDLDIYLEPKNDFLINSINPAFGITDREKIQKVGKQARIKIILLRESELSWNIIQEKIAQQVFE